jgi:[histone H3]-trimethyl-L-lysine4 demethylase
MFTCPICDWRVKIPRDAARPKLEELQAWQGELTDLPFQPEEEGLLARIVEKAQKFRDFLSAYTNGNQLCRTIEAMPEMLFYLRKIEGAEVLLTNETNVFRQELHKWQKIAPEAPPILNASYSTRKPRPTKQQKMMKEHGVEKPEDLPPHARTKTYARRKTQDGFAPPGTLMPKPSTQSPAPGSASSPGPSHLGQGRSATPSGMPRTASTGNAPAFASGVMPADGAFDGSFGAPGTYDTNAASPMFSPSQDAGPMISTRLGDDSEAADPSFPTFKPSLGMDADDDIRNGLAGTHAQQSDAGPAPHGNDFDDMSIDIGVPRSEMGEATDWNDDAAPSLEHEASHASEALEMIGEGEDGGLQDGESVSKEFDDFLSGGGDQ